MTTKTSLLKRSGWLPTFLETLKRNRSVWIFSMVLMLSAPVQVFLQYDGNQSWIAGAGGLYTFLNLIAVLVPYALAVILPFMVFGYLFSRQAIDTYHALPVRRTSLFIGKFSAGLLLALSPCVITYGAAALTAMAVNASNELMEMAFKILCSVVSIYTFVVFVIICCGTVWETILYGIGLTVALFGLSYALPDMMRQLYGYAGVSDLSEWFLAFTPFYYTAGAVTSGDHFTYLDIISLIVTGVLFVLALLLYQNRKSENTGSAFSFRALFYIVSGFITLAVILLIDIELEELASALLVGFLAHFVMSVIANRGFRRLLPVILRGVGISAIAAAFLILFDSTGGFGYENRLPAVADIASVTVNRFELGDAQTYHNYSGRSMLYGGGNSFEYDQEENIRLLRETHQMLLENREEEGDGYASSEWRVPLVLEYRLKSGNTVKRAYRITSQKPLQKLMHLNQSAEFLEEKYPFLQENYTYGLQARAVILDPLPKEYGGELMAYEALGVSADEVAEQLKKDILARPSGFEITPTAGYIGRIAILTEKPVNKGVESLSYRKPQTVNQPVSITPYGHSKTKWQYAQTVLVYECDKNILGLLERLGKLERFRNGMKQFTETDMIELLVHGEQPSDHCFHISNMEAYYYEKYTPSGEIFSDNRYIVTDAADRAYLLRHLQPIYYSDEECHAILIGGNAYLLPPEYSGEVAGIIERAEKTQY